MKLKTAITTTHQPAELAVRSVTYETKYAQDYQDTSQYIISDICRAFDTVHHAPIDI